MFRCSQTFVRRYSLLHVQRPTVLDAQYNNRDVKQIEKDQLVVVRKDESIPAVDISGAVRRLLNGTPSLHKDPSTLHGKDSLVVSRRLQSFQAGSKSSGHYRTFDTLSKEFWLIVFSLACGYFSRPFTKQSLNLIKNVVDSHDQWLDIRQYCPSTRVQRALTAPPTADIEALDETSTENAENQSEVLSPIDAACAALKAESERCTGALLNQYAMVYLRREAYSTAFEYFVAASEKGHIPAMYNIGVCYEKGQGVKKSGKDALMYFLKAADQGHAESMWNVGMFHYEQKNETVGFEYMKGAADKGLARACSFVALRYAEKEMWEEAFTYFDKGAEKEDRASLFNLALCYDNGLGTSYNRERAGQCYLRAAELGDATSQLRVGEAHQHGTRGMKRDLHEALRWMEQSAGNGNNEAQCSVHELQDLIAKEKSEPLVNIFSFLKGGKIIDHHVKSRDSPVR